MRTVAIVQARVGSVRLPNKVMRPVLGVPLIELLLRRLSRAGRIDQIVVAIPEDPGNQPLAEHVSSLGFAIFAGSETDVLDRYYGAARKYRADTVVRITGDCPLVDPALVDEMIGAYESSNCDYLSNTGERTYPDGLDTEVFSFRALERAAAEAAQPAEREHVTPFIRDSGLFTVCDHRHTEDLSRERWTVDEAPDLSLIAAVFNYFAPRTDFSWLEVVALSREQPALFAVNRGGIPNEGSWMNTGQKFWRRARQVIPGGNMLLSKRPEMFLPEHWPAYFSRARGCTVWDLDGTQYTDMSLMGVGTNTLGYGHPEVDAAVTRTIQAGNMSTLNCPEEVELAERLVAMHPWSDMVRFARSGGEANAIAIRIARAAAGKDLVAVCGYHGWHDWYLAANLGDDERLAGHLLPGLEPRGVPRALRNTVVPFAYNDVAELETLVNEHEVGVIMMEVARNHEPQPGYLQRVRELATRHGIVLIFDECTSGFRQTFGGLHRMYGVDPDMAVFGKTLGNGYAITATVGRREVMEAAQGTFISSTFWTERIGPSAALKTLEVMERISSWEQITRIGSDIASKWQALADRHGLTVRTRGLPSLATLEFDSPNALAYKTLITQEMLAKGYLATTAVYACTEHTAEVVATYMDALDPVFSLIRECEDGRDVTELLRGPVCHGGFRRLN